MQQNDRIDTLIYKRGLDINASKMLISCESEIPRIM